MDYAHIVHIVYAGGQVQFPALRGPLNTAGSNA